MANMFFFFSFDTAGGNITVLGSSFTNNTGSVFIGSEKAIVTFWSDNRINLYVGEIECGVHELQIDVNSGFAVNSTDLQLPKVIADLKITYVYPLQGSSLGGTQLTIIGSGFGTNISHVKVKVGTVNCNIITLSNSEITCLLEYAGTTHYVTNKGIDPGFGVYYAFDRSFITIKEGDFVQWSWETPSFVNNITHAIIEVDSPSSVTQKPGGFRSGIPSRNGVFTNQFVRTGMYYVWSGFVDIWGIKNYAGTIKVVQANSTSEKISVRVGKAEAEHVTGDEIHLVDSTVCKHISTGKTGCTEREVSFTDNSVFSFAYWSCYTPIVNSVNVNNGTTKTNIIITGEGFSYTECQNEVSFGGQRCHVTTASENSLTCNIEKIERPDVAILHQLELKVNNRGSARINIIDANHRGFALLPNIENISPTNGSIAGGTLLTVTGFGFESPLITIGGYNCIIIDCSYSEITCETPGSLSEDEKEVNVFTYVQGIPLQSKCETESGDCTFSYKSELTSTITTISPNILSGTTFCTITGTSLGNDTTELHVTIGNVVANVAEAADTYIVVNVDNIPAGDNVVVVRVKDYGSATGVLTVYGSLIINNVIPSSGSIHGETPITILGNGFIKNNTSVTVGGKSCFILSTTLSKISCITQAHNAGSVSIAVVSNGLSNTSASYIYATASTPTITSIIPTSGFPGDTLTIFGSNFMGDGVTVYLGQSRCDVISENTDQIECIIGNHPTGNVTVYVQVADLGMSNTNKQFEYQLSLLSIAPMQGGIAGGQLVLLTGTGIDSSAVATICGKTCLLRETTSSTYLCRTPANPAQTCDVGFSLNGLNRILPTAYSYISSLTPTISNVSPRRGGTGGGSRLTITGAGFGSNIDNARVEIDGVSCMLSNISNTEIRCITGPHIGSIQTKVEVQVSHNGIANEVSTGDADFQYVDVWSSPFTWGGGPLPEIGDFVVIPSGTTILLDMDTPVLSFLLIQGGNLIFDEKDLELQANIIMITDGGHLQVGTKDQPFQHQGVITLHGHLRSKELPIYGTKVLAIRNGTLDLYGIPLSSTWTHLSETAEKGSDILHLKAPVEWKSGDEIVIASTGNRLSQHENEKKIISEVSADGKILKLTTPLKAEHISVQEMFHGRLVEMRAEVGLLSRNVIVRGNEDPQWNDEIKPCTAGFQFGQFGTHKCSLARFGDEIGSSQFGVVIYAHSPIQDIQAVQIHLAYTEVRFAGQTFRSGRHPLHFYLNGNVSKSYVQGCSFHNTFNRAVNIQGSQNILIEQNVLYDILGGGIVLEDGSETGITLRYNLVMQVTGCATLVNDDLTPASFSLANPKNTVQHNAVAGGTHHGYWYRLDYHSVGASYMKHSCTKHVPLKIFQNNSAHSLGGVGLYIYKEYFPRKHGCGGSEVEVAIFDYLLSWNNNKGVAADKIGAVQFFNFTLVQNQQAGIEIYSVSDFPRYTADSPSVQNSVIIGKTTKEHGCTQGGIVFPLGRGFRVRNVSFVNFNETNCAAFRWTRSLLHCPVYCGGFTYHVESAAYINTPNKAIFAWDWEGIILDIDGKHGNSTVLPTTGTLPHDCEPAPEFSIGVPASTCPPKYKWHRYSFNNYYHYNSRYYLRRRNFIITNQYGNSSVPYAQKRFSHNYGWTCALLNNTSYKFYFENVLPVNNISFYGTFYDLEERDFLFISMTVLNFPDWFSVEGERINASSGNIEHHNGSYGDWNWNNLNKEIRFLVNTFSKSQHHAETGIVDTQIHFKIYKCFYVDCVPPPDPDKTPPSKHRPLSFHYWHDTSIWKRWSDGYMKNVGKNGAGLPRDFDNVEILPHTWVLVNLTAICKLRNLLLHGVLEFANAPEAVYNIEADFIIIKGGRLIIGWPDDPFDGLATITLRGNHSSSSFNVEGATLGSRAIGVFGGLDLIGEDKGVAWTYLDDTANLGSRRIVLLEKVRWSKGDEIVISATGLGPGQSETFKIDSVGTDQVTIALNDTLKFQHIVHTETLENGRKFTLRAAVGLLSHNIKITDEDTRKFDKKAFGARVLVGHIVDKEKTYTGYARLSNVEFYHTGQYGFWNIYDPRFSLVFLNVGHVSNIKPSSLTNCSFHNGFNTAVGLIGIENLNVTDNVIYANHGLKTTSVGTSLVRNLIIGSEGTGIEAMRAVNLTLKDNLVADSKTDAFNVPALACDVTSDRYKNNKVYSNVRGAVLAPRFYTRTMCVKITGFIAWKNTNFGLLYEGNINAVFEENTLIENMIGVGAVIINQYSTKQSYMNRTIQIRNTTFIGQTTSFNCGDMVWLGSNRFLPSAILGQYWHFSEGMVGLVFPTYNIIGGMTKIENVTFAKYGDSTCNKNYAITTNLARNDLQRPINSERVTMFDVEHANKVLFQRPYIRTSHRCFGIDCNVFRLGFFKDLDGTFLGHSGAVIPMSEHEAIDYSRIPREMVTELDGTRIPYEEIAPNKGVVRNNNCTYQWRWQAFECMDDLNYKMLTIENMDRDAKNRQISPVALLSDGYIDLIDVPLDHGYCIQYTCRRKQSLFIALVATSKSYLLHFTRTTPRHVRYSILNVGPNEGIKLTVWYSGPNRLDVFVDGEFAIATNARIDKNGRYILTMPKENEFEPHVTNETGTNYFDRNRGEITFTIKGPAQIEVVSQNTMIVSFGLPALSVSEFFGENIVENLAAFLDIPLTKVRIVNIVSASVNGRRKRSESDLNIEIEIGDEPVQVISSNTTLPDSIDYLALTDLVSIIVNECQLGNISNILGETIVCGIIEFPSDDSEMVSIVYNNQKPHHLYFYDEPEPEYEGVLLKTQPKLRAVDIDGDTVTELGTVEYPWQITVNLRNDTGHPLAVLNGNLTINCSQGWFNFTDLVISHSGTGYILDFDVIYPNEADLFTLTSKPFNVFGRPLKINVCNQTDDNIFKDDQFTVSLDLLDQHTDEIITHIAWREHTWSSEVSLLHSSVYANLTGFLNTSFDEETGRVTFYNLTVTGVGWYYLKFRVLSDPPEYNLTLSWRLAIKDPAHVNMTVEESTTIKLKFDEVFEVVLPTEDDRNAFEQELLTDYANLCPGVQLNEGIVYKGKSTN
ncbi:fibrocystin-L-like isoform X2 [Mercenaria mercenaria]|uniref:fibrocystin-L-like isoform X2 n=1 Tax=Mercenaria mercenaria TaxID=6596 RepID=UPI00234E607B|nr:fibrocystin-L-like isoform X2 [Mercenaria mercenaria]